MRSCAKTAEEGAHLFFTALKKIKFYCWNESISLTKRVAKKIWQVKKDYLSGKIPGKGYLRRTYCTVFIIPGLECTIVDPIASLLDLQNRYSPLRLLIRFHSCL
jgi:hypothetical protein